MPVGYEVLGIIKGTDIEFDYGIYSPIAFIR